MISLPRAPAAILTRTFNATWWRRLLLPSSNGYFTGRALGRIFGALANGGRVRVDTDGGVGRGTAAGAGGGGGGGKGGGGKGEARGGEAWGVLASEAAVREIASCVADASRDVASDHPDLGSLPLDDPYPARDSSGFFPWATPELHGPSSSR